MNSMTSPSTDFLVKIDDIINSCLSDKDFNIQQLAKEVGYSYTHTYRRLQTATGLSPSVYIRNKRLDSACQFLINTDLTINQIAFQVGFKTQSYFSAKFSEYMGCSPKYYREKGGV